jgi:hypothetical protein
VIGPQLQSGRQVGSPDVERFSGSRKDQIERNRADPLPRQLHGPCHAGRLVISLQDGKLSCIERLSAQADPGHAVPGQDPHALVVHVGRIAFNTELGARIERKPFQHRRQQPFELRRRQVRGRAASDEQRVDRPRPLEPGELPGQCLQVAVDQVVAAGDHGEVAVAAAVPAERDVDVGRPGSRTGKMRNFALHKFYSNRPRGGRLNAAHHSQRCNRPSSMSGTAWPTMCRICCT